MEAVGHPAARIAILSTPIRAALVAALSVVSLIASASPLRVRTYSFHRDGVLGTSLDLSFVAASGEDARIAEAAVLDEIERVRRILSTYDSTSEISRLIEAGRLDHPSRELLDVLRGYEAWVEQSGGAYSPRIGELTSIWNAAARTGVVPANSVLARAATRARQPAWRIDPASGAVTVSVGEPLDVSSYGKGYIVGQGLKAARAAVPSLHGAMIDIGGDVRTWGEAPGGRGLGWRIGVADPRAPADNAPPLTRLLVTDRAVSSSGSYARGFDVGGRHYSHIVDPRTGWPADGVVGVTVIAADNATANALATTLSVLSPEAGLRLVASVTGAEALLMTSSGEIRRSAGFAAFEDPEVTYRERAIDSMAAPIPRATVTFDITPREFLRDWPYVAVWVTDTSGGLVRTLAVWGNDPRFVRELSQWFSIARRNDIVVDGVTRGTRRPGQYVLEWNGLDEWGTPVKPGTYVFWLEASFEHGPHNTKKATVSCGPTPASALIEPSISFVGGGRVACSTTPK